MAKNVYGTVAAIAWIIGHYFYNSKHFLYLSDEFYPYRLKNPRSSNPYLIYQDLYEPWRDADDYNKVITMYRLALWGGVDLKMKEGVIDSSLANRLKRICNKINIAFFYPVICRVDIHKLLKDSGRIKIAGSGHRGSSEYLIKDLGELEIDEILFLDFVGDRDFERVVTSEYYGFRRTRRYQIHPDAVLNILERRCDSIGLQLPFSIT